MWGGGSSESGWVVGRLEWLEYGKVEEVNEVWEGWAVGIREGRGSQ